MRVEIWSDVVCPWCYIGKRKFEMALASYQGDETFEVIYRPYQLDPTAPVGAPVPVLTVYEKKFGGPAKAAEIIERVSAVAESVGLPMAMDKALRANTRDAHRLLGWSLEHHGAVVQSMLKGRLMQAYFAEGEDVGSHGTLARLAADCGLDRADVLRFLASDEGGVELQNELDEALDIGVTGVPHFVFDRRWAIPGAQDPEVFLRAFERMAVARQQTSDVDDDDE